MACWRATRRPALLPRAGIVHRLDKDTSGLMVVARTRQAMDALVQLIAAREVSAAVPGAGAPPLGRAGARARWRRPIGRDPRNRLRMAVVDLERHAGKTATHHGRVAADSASTAAGCAARCKPGAPTRSACTWRPSAIRWWRDAVYGGAPAAGLQRQALHAFRLAFVHPVTRQALEFHAPLPPDLAAGLDGLGPALQCSVNEPSARASLASLSRARCLNCSVAGNAPT